jgi:hypothetical protein
MNRGVHNFKPTGFENLAIAIGLVANDRRNDKNSRHVWGRTKDEG